jgi:hypothetical protein
MYGEQQIGPEQFIWHGDDEVIYSKNIVDERSFTYSKGERTPNFTIRFLPILHGRCAQGHICYIRY